jgi:hypothetical protein
MKKYKGVAGQILYCHCDNILCARQARMSMPHESFGLETSCAHPLIHERKTDATMPHLAPEICTFAGNVSGKILRA